VYGGVLVTGPGHLTEVLSEMIGAGNKGRYVSIPSKINTPRGRGRGEVDKA
jgi:hypothetical protein